MFGKNLKDSMGISGNDSQQEQTDPQSMVQEITQMLSQMQPDQLKQVYIICEQLKGD